MVAFSARGFENLRTDVRVDRYRGRRVRDDIQAARVLDEPLTARARPEMGRDARVDRRRFAVEASGHDFANFGTFHVVPVVVGGCLVPEPPTS